MFHGLEHSAPSNVLNAENTKEGLGIFPIFNNNLKPDN